MGRSVVFVHGMFMTPACWDGWVARFEKVGYRCVAPPWPSRGRSDRALARLTLGDLVARYEQVVLDEGRSSLLVGHSMGGLVVQLLLQRGLGACGAAICSAAPRGLVSLRPSFLASCAPLLDPRTLRRPYRMPFWQFCFAFAGTVPAEVRRALYERQVVPESLRVGRGALSRDASVDFARKRSPLLLVAAGCDRLAPASLVRRNAAQYRDSPSRTDYVEFPGRSHVILLEDGWIDVADAVQRWADENWTASWSATP